ncbi:DUF2247 family protein [Bacillus sp. JCM 19041]|uniref:DUF2247 family protein n=1 Tax=Bacillus sp. JCM 19041 TaxID=1460637 RepID=UPI0006CF4962
MVRLLDFQIKDLSEVKVLNFYSDVYLNNDVDYNWLSFYVGLKMNLLNHRDITKYAEDFITKNPEADNEDIIQLAWGGEQLDYEQLLENIINALYENNLLHDQNSWDHETRKLRFGLLNYYRKNYDGNELLEKIVLVYVDFDYPEEMDNFINYLEPKDYNPALYSREENIRRLVNNFNCFMFEEEKAIRMK